MNISPSQMAQTLPELTLPWRTAQFENPEIVVLNEPLAKELGYNPAQLRTEKGTRHLLGETAPDPVVTLYAGHQFGGYSPLLGDGRALLLGELERDGIAHEIQLKGSGPTPLSRGGDGYAPLSPMLREHLVSEAMHHLGIPTTRSLAVIATNAPVQRERVEPGAVLVRVAESHLRIGTFELVSRTRRRDLLERLVTYTLRRHHPGLEGENPARDLLAATISQQAELTARWMLVGFVHGVLNTDNIALSGETLDYGPCAFLEGYDPEICYSSIDTGGRYRYRNQPLVTGWNLARYAETLLPLLAERPEEAVEVANEELSRYEPAYQRAWEEGIAAKLGLPAGPEATQLGEALHTRMQEGKLPYTQTYTHLTRVAGGEEPGAEISDWIERWRGQNPDPEVMQSVNPTQLPRNHLLEAALQSAEEGNLEPYNTLLSEAQDPYTKHPSVQQEEAAPSAAYVTYCGT